VCSVCKSLQEKSPRFSQCWHTGRFLGVWLLNVFKNHCKGLAPTLTNMNLPDAIDLHNMPEMHLQLHCMALFDKKKEQYDSMLPELQLEAAGVRTMQELTMLALRFIEHVGLHPGVVESILQHNAVVEVVELWHTRMPVLLNDGNDSDDMFAHTELSCCSWGELLTFPSVPPGVSSDEFQQRAQFLCFSAVMSCKLHLCAEMFEVATADAVFASHKIAPAERDRIEHNAMDFWVHAIAFMYTRRDGALVPTEGAERVALGHAHEHAQDEIQHDINMISDQMTLAEIGFEPVLFNIARELKCLDLVLMSWDNPIPTVISGPGAHGGVFKIMQGEGSSRVITIGDVFIWPHLQIIRIPDGADNQTELGRYNIRIQPERVRKLRHKAMLMLAHAHYPPFLTDTAGTAEMVTEAEFADVSRESNRKFYEKCHRTLMMVMVQMHASENL